MIPAGVGSAFADILGAEFRQIVDFITERASAGWFYDVKTR